MTTPKKVTKPAPKKAAPKKAATAKASPTDEQKLQLALDQEQAMFDQANAAAKAFSKLDAKTTQKIFAACAEACVETAEKYAEWAVEETGFGHVGDKTLKNILGAVGLFQDHNAFKYAMPEVDTSKKIITIPKPAGVVLALIPCTNPVATVFFKALSTLVTRNAVILCPHPAAVKCSNDAAAMLARIAEENGAPKGAIQWLETPSVDQVGRMMKSSNTSVILATGGPGMVRAAYSSGNPALGVGCANVPCYVDSSADAKKAGNRIAESVCFDNALPCTTESVAIVHTDIASKVRISLTTHKTRKAVWVVGEDFAKLRTYLYPEGKFNMEALGKDADVIAEAAGFSVPEGTRTLLVEISEISTNEPFSLEKMCPVLAFLEVPDSEAGLQASKDMLDIMGKGHSAIIHSKNADVIEKFGEEIEVCRLPVNAPGVTGSSGFDTNIPGGPVIGTGFFGRSSIDRNITPADLVQSTRVAFNKSPLERMHGATGESLSTIEKAHFQANRGVAIAKILAKALPMLKKYK